MAQPAAEPTEVVVGSTGELLTPLGDPGDNPAGWASLGGVMLLVIGGMGVVYAVVAIVNHEWAVWANRSVLLLTTSQWGWVHLGLGGVLAFAGLGVLGGTETGRRIGVVVTALAMLVSFLALPAYPLWSLVMLTLEVLVLYCLVARASAPGRRQHPGVCRHT